MASAVVYAVGQRRLDRELVNLLRQVGHIDITVPVVLRKGKHHGLSQGGQAGEVTRPRRSASLSAMPKDHRRTHRDNGHSVACLILGGKVLVEQLGERVVQDVISRGTEILFVDGTIAITELALSVH